MEQEFRPELVEELQPILELIRSHDYWWWFSTILHEQKYNLGFANELLMKFTSEDWDYLYSQEKRIVAMMAGLMHRYYGEGYPFSNTKYKTGEKIPEYMYHGNLEEFVARCYNFDQCLTQHQLYLNDNDLTVY